MEIDRRKFQSDTEYKNAIKDTEKIAKIRKQYNLNKYEDVDKLYSQMMSGSITFLTSIGDEFDDEIYELRQKLSFDKSVIKSKKNPKSSKANKKAEIDEEDSVVNKNHLRSKEDYEDAAKEKIISQTIENSRTYGSDDPEMDELIKKELIKLERRRKFFIVFFALAAATCIGYFIFYYYSVDRSERRMQEVAGLVGSDSMKNTNKDTVKANITNPDNPDAPPVLEQYQTVYNSNKKLIGWLQIDDTNIDYPVMQCGDNEFYLSHNFDSEEDKTGALFLDCNCDVIKGNDNYIIYGHHLTSGKMFSSLVKYEDQSFYEKHKYIRFDTIYEEHLYQVMFAFRSKVYNEDDVVFKYYQFIDANSEEEFNSYMLEMSEQAFYETGVWAFYGDELLTLSTCDYHQDNGRFVVVAKRIN